MVADIFLYLCILTYKLPPPLPTLQDNPTGRKVIISQRIYSEKPAFCLELVSGSRDGIGISGAVLGRCCGFQRDVPWPSPKEKTKTQSIQQGRTLSLVSFPPSSSRIWKGLQVARGRKRQGYEKKHRVTVSVIRLLGNRNNATRKSRNGKGETIFLSFFLHQPCVSHGASRARVAPLSSGEFGMSSVNLNSLGRIYSAVKQCDGTQTPSSAAFDAALEELNQ